MCITAVEKGILSASKRAETQQQPAQCVFLNSSEKTVRKLIVSDQRINTCILQYYIGSLIVTVESDVTLVAGAVGGAVAILTIILLVLCVVIVFVIKMKKKRKDYSTTASKNVFRPS